jgi:hypothetical protein
MSMADFQAALGRIYVDELMRQLLELAPEKALAPYRLTEREKQALLGIDREQLEFFCLSLYAKKHKRVREVYEATHRLCSSDYERHFRRYYGMRTTLSHEHPSEYTYGFGVFLEQVLLADPLPDAPFAADLVRFEREVYRARYPDRRDIRTVAVETSGPDEEAQEISGSSCPRLRGDVVVFRFTVDVMKLNMALRAGHPAPPVEPGARYIAFKPATDMTAPRLYQLPTRLGEVLMSCDGVRDITRLAGSAAARAGRTPSSVTELAEAVRHFLELGLVACDAS